MFNYRNPSCPPRCNYQRNSVNFPIKTEQGLALTPSMVADLTQKGLAVNSNIGNLQFDDGCPNPPGVLLEQRRGIDANDVWNASKSAKKKLQSVINSQQNPS